jgi:hypothetical protein
MINRNGSFIYGYIAGANDRTACYPMNNESFENLTPEYHEGYKAGYEGKGSVVIEMPDELTACLSVGDRVKRGKIGHVPYLDIAGTIEAIGTELGSDYYSIRWDGNNTGFCAQVHKDSLVKVD